MPSGNNQIAMQSQPVLSWRKEIASRVVIGLLVFVVVMALSQLLPPRLQGELALDQMAKRADHPCPNCEPTEQIVAVGLAPGDDKWYVNVRFAMPPVNSSVLIAFEDVRDGIEVRQTGKSWRLAGTEPIGSPQILGVVQRDDHVIFTFPAIRTNGVRVAAPAGGPVPASGFAAPVFPSPAHFNPTDLAIVLILGFGVWCGFKRGLELELPNLLVAIGSIVFAIAVRRPAASQLGAMTGSPQTGALLGGGLTIVVLSMAGILLLPALQKLVGAGSEAMDFRMKGICGSTAAAVRLCMVLAMLLTLATDLSVLAWASSSIDSSLIGGSLVRAWRGLFV